MKFLADMGISPKTITFLKGINHDATHLHEQNLGTLSDSKILEKSLSEGRILLTHDLDFGELVARSGGKLPSVVIFRLRNMSPENVNKYLHNIITFHHELLNEGVIISVTEGQIRSRILPIIR